MKSREQKRMEAEARDAEYRALTPQERMQRVRQRRGSSLRERERLIALIESGQAHRAG